MRAVVATVVALLAVRSTEAFQEDMNITDLDKPPVDLDAIDAPRDVYVTVAVNKVGSIDSMASTFKFDFYIYVAWRDDRQPEGEFVPDGSTWWPQPEIMNFHEGVKGEWFCLFAPGSPKFTKLNTDEGMWAVCQTRHQPFLDAEVLLLDFPFDHQNANIEIESFMWGSNILKFVAAPSLQAGIMPPGGNMAVSGWKIRSTDVITRDHEYKLFGETYHQIVLVLALQRLPDYYVSRYVWGAVFLVAMCFLSLCIPSEEADRSALALGSFLGIVAWEFILVTGLPPTGYNTRLDDFMVISLVCVLILYAWNAVRRPLVAPPCSARLRDSAPGSGTCAFHAVRQSAFLNVVARLVNVACCMASAALGLRVTGRMPLTVSRRAWGSPVASAFISMYGIACPCEARRGEARGIVCRTVHNLPHVRLVRHNIHSASMGCPQRPTNIRHAMICHNTQPNLVRFAAASSAGSTRRSNHPIRRSPTPALPRLSR